MKDIEPHDILKYGIIPELVGRLPVITTLEPLSREMLVRVLTEPKNSFVQQYKKLLRLDGIELDFEQEALEGNWRTAPLAAELARVAFAPH